MRLDKRWFGLAAVVALAGCAATPPPHDMRVVTVAGPMFGIQKLMHRSDVVRIAGADEHVLCYGDCPKWRHGTTGEAIWIYFADPVPLDLSPKDETDPERVSDELLRTTVASANFNFDSARLVGQLSGLESFLVVARERTNTRIVIEGHTDSVGSASYNRSLSRLRAMAVQRWLAERGVEKSRIEIRGLGESRPVASNESPEGRAKNRRAEAVLKIVVASAPAAGSADNANSEAMSHE